MNLALIKKYFTKDISFSNIRFSDLPCYVREGFGGKPIEGWPPYTFFKLYLKGKKEKARVDFACWYQDQLDKYHNVSKKEGGMYKGSLYRLIEEEAQRPFDEVGAAEKKKAISKRVAQRFSLFESIKNEGYKSDTEQIQGVHKKGKVYLDGGHHRAVILRVLGKDTLPNVLVFPNQALRSFYTKVR